MLLPSELQDQARTATAAAITVANKHFDRLLPVPQVLFNLTGHTAGYADYRKWLIRINNDLLIKYPDEQIQNTVPHEVAHLVANEIYGSAIPPHGFEWQSIMQLFGLAPKRCHRMQTTPARRVKKYEIFCGCSEKHFVTKVVINRMRMGYTYTCRSCRQPLFFNPVEKPSFDSLLDSIK